MNHKFNLVHIKIIFNIIKIFKIRGVFLPLSEETGEGINFLSPVFLFSPRKDRCCKLKSSYQHLKHFLSVVSYRSEHRWSSGLRLGEANSEKAKTNRKDNDTSA